MPHRRTMARAFSVLIALTAILTSGQAARAQADSLNYEPVEGDIFAENLGIYYQIVSQGKPAGAKLSGYSGFLGSALKPLGLERGDVIVALDDQPIKTEQDLAGHYSRTSITYVDSKTGATRKAMIDLPPMSVRPRLNQDTVRQFAARSLRDRSIPYSPPVFQVDGDVVHSAVGEPELDSVAPDPVVQQLKVEIIRLERGRPTQRAFWEPFLQRVEAVIAEEITAWNKGEMTNPQAQFAFDERIHDIYEEAFRANAAAIGKRYAPPVLTPQAAPSPVVRLLTVNNLGVIYTMPRTKYLIRQLDAARRPITLVEFDSITPNTERTMEGDYVYKVVYPNGAETPMRSLRVAESGAIRLP